MSKEPFSLVGLLFGNLGDTLDEVCKKKKLLASSGRLVFDKPSGNARTTFLLESQWIV